MKKLVIVSNNFKSRSAKALAATLSQKLGYKVYRVKPDRVRRRVPFVLRGGTPKDVQLERFNQAEVPHPEYTNSREVAQAWIDEGRTVMCRKLLMSSEGKGIVVAGSKEELVPAKLYTKYVPKKEEYRVHVFNGQVIDVQQKRKRRGFEDERNTKVRNLANGYVFCRDNINEPEGLRTQAVKACNALRYNLGAVDIAYNVKNNQLVVLEVNANPGMQGTTLDKYADAIIRSMK